MFRLRAKRMFFIALTIVSVLMTSMSATHADSNSAITGAMTWAQNEMNTNPSAYYDLCLPFVEDAYNTGGGISINDDYAPNPVVYWSDHASLQHPGDVNAPKGALVIWGANTYTTDGHIALSLGDGVVISSAERGNPDIHTFTIADRNAGGYASSYLGWMIPPGVSAPQANGGGSGSLEGQGVGTAAYRGTDHLNNGQVLLSNQYILSQNVEYALVMQGDGNLVLYGQGFHTLWASGTAGHPGAYVGLQSDGNIVIYAGGRAIWATGTTGTGMVYLKVQTDGNLVAYTDAGSPVWASHTVYADTGSYRGTDHLNNGQVLHASEYIRSGDGRYALVMQTDGNLVLYGPGYHPLWSSRTSGHPSAYLGLQSDGNIVIYAGGKAIWATGTAHSGMSYLKMQTDGNLVAYNPSRSVWSSGTNGKI